MSLDILDKSIQLLNTILTLQNTLERDDCKRISKRCVFILKFLQKAQSKIQAKTKSIADIANILQQLNAILEEILEFIDETRYRKHMLIVINFEAYLQEQIRLNCSLLQIRGEFIPDDPQLVPSVERRKEDIDDLKGVYKYFINKSLEEINDQKAQISDGFHSLRDFISQFPTYVQYIVTTFKYPVFAKREMADFNVFVNKLATNITSRETMLLEEYDSFMKDSLFIHQLLNKSTSHELANDRKKILEDRKLTQEDVEVTNIITGGKGGFGIVYCGKFRKRVDVGFKVIRCLKSSFSNDQIRVIENELLVMNYLLPHPHLVYFYGYILEPKRVLIILEKPSYASLDTVLTDKSKYMDLPLDLTLAWLYDIAQAINYIHSKNIIHKDIKAETLLVFDRFTLKLCDFGYSSRYSMLSSSSNMIINVSNVAPEILAGKEPSFACDIYSFAMTAIQIFTRDFPKQDEPTDQVYLALQTLEFPNENTKNLLESLLFACLEYSEDISLDILRPTSVQLETRIKRLLDSVGGDPREKADFAYFTKHNFNLACKSEDSGSICSISPKSDLKMFGEPAASSRKKSRKDLSPETIINPSTDLDELIKYDPKLKTSMRRIDSVDEIPSNIQAEFKEMASEFRRLDFSDDYNDINKIESAEAVLERTASMYIQEKTQYNPNDCREMIVILESEIKMNPEGFSDKNNVVLKSKTHPVILTHVLRNLRLYALRSSHNLVQIDREGGISVLLTLVRSEDLLIRQEALAVLMLLVEHNEIRKTFPSDLELFKWFVLLAKDSGDQAKIFIYRILASLLLSVSNQEFFIKSSGIPTLVNELQKTNNIVIVRYILLSIKALVSTNKSYKIFFMNMKIHLHLAKLLLFFSSFLSKAPPIKNTINQKFLLNNTYPLHSLIFQLICNIIIYITNVDKNYQLLFGMSDIMVVLVHLLTYAPRHRVRDQVLLALINLSHVSDNNVLFVELLGVKPLMELYYNGTFRQREYALGVLWNIAANNSKFQLTIADQPGIITALLRTIQKGREKQKDYALGLLSSLATFSKDVKTMIYDANSIPVLVSVMKYGTEKQKGYAAGAFVNIAHSKESVSDARKAGVIPPLIQLMLQGNETQKQYAIAAIYNISHSKTAVLDLLSHPILEILFDVLAIGDNNLKIYAIGALKNIISNQEAMIQQIHALNGISLLIQQLESESEKIAQAAAIILRRLNINVDEYTT